MLAPAYLLKSLAHLNVSLPLKLLLQFDAVNVVKPSVSVKPSVGSGPKPLFRQLNIVFLSHLKYSLERSATAVALVPASASATSKSALIVLIAEKNFKLGNNDFGFQYRDRNDGTESIYKV